MSKGAATPIKDALEQRLSELVDLVNTTNRVATRINGKFVLDRDKVIPFVLGGLFTPPAPGRDALRERGDIDALVEIGWAAIVGSDVAPICFNASIIRADLKTAISAILSALPISTKKVYIKSLRTIVEIQTTYADQIRDLLNAGCAPDKTDAILSALPVAPVWQAITDDNEPPRDIPLLLGWWNEWPKREWECAAGLWGSTKGGWNHGQATHWTRLPGPDETMPVAPVVDEAAIRADERSSIIADLQGSYPDHAWLNAVCAAVRSRGTAIRAGGGER